MKKVFFLITLILLTSCNKPKTVFICGDHVCVNKAEAKEYFEKNLSLEVKVIDRKDKKQVKLVELNLKPNRNGKREISISKKESTNENLKVLSKNEIKNKKKELKRNKKNKNINIEKQTVKNIFVAKKTVSKSKSDVVDVCSLIQKCSIDEISKYLINEGKNKKFPNLTKRE